MVSRRPSRINLSPTPVVVVTIGVLLCMYLFTGIAANFVPGGVRAYELLALDSRLVAHGEVWRLLTYGLLHSLMDPFHILFNALMLWFFGRDLEHRFGTVRFIVFLWTAVLVGGLSVLASGLLGLGSGMAIGFSAACEAAIVLWALLNRNAQVNLFMVLPIRGIHMLALAILMWVLQAVSVSNVSAAAHFGGIVTGFVAWLLTSKRNRIRLFVDEVMQKLRIRKGPKLTVVPPKKDRWVN